ncbi:MAG: hypothetical protein ACLQPN_00285 [Bryobacteraceae bacterium]
MRRFTVRWGRLGHADPRVTACDAHVVDIAKKNPAVFIPLKVG